MLEKLIKNMKCSKFLRKVPSLKLHFPLQSSNFRSFKIHILNIPLGEKKIMDKQIMDCFSPSETIQTTLTNFLFILLWTFHCKVTENGHFPPVADHRLLFSEQFRTVFMPVESSTMPCCELLIIYQVCITAWWFHSSEKHSTRKHFSYTPDCHRCPDWTQQLTSNTH